jgi:hypothetical protein
VSRSCGTLAVKETFLMCEKNLINYILLFALEANSRFSVADSEVYFLGKVCQRVLLVIGFVFAVLES